MDWSNILNNLVNTAGNVANTAINGKFNQTAAQSGSFTTAGGSSSAADVGKYTLPLIAGIVLLSFIIRAK